VRYEYPSVLAERRQHATGFLPGYGPVIAGTDLALDVDPSARGLSALAFHSVPSGLPAGGAWPDRNNIAPMAGFGWSPFHDRMTVIRGGARIAYDDLFNNVPAGMVLAAPYNLQTTQTANVTQPGKFAWPLAFNQNVPLISNYGQQGPGTPTAGVLGFQAVDPHLRSSRAYVYSLTVERRIGSLFVEAGYRGSQGRHLGMFVDINQPFVIVRDPSKRGPVAPNEQIFPYNHFGQVQLAKSIGNSSYNGMVLTARRTLNRGLLFQANYLLGKSLDYNSSYFGSGNLPGETGAPIDNRNIRLEHGPSAFDVRQQFMAFFTAEVPAPFRSDAVSRVVLAGWRLSGIATFQTGTPFTVVTGNPDGSGFNQSTAGTSPDGGNRPNLVKTGPVPRNNGNPDAAFDTSWFAQNLAGQNGTSGRNVYRGPGIENINLAIAKSFSLSRVREQVRASIRADLFNSLNHTNFANPTAGMSNAAFGRITQTLGSAVATSAGVSSGPPGGPRIVQLSLRLQF